jgi:hypothetical protein
MRYGTWNLLFTDNLSEGATTPIELSGAFYSNLEQTEIVGYIPDTLDITTLSDWAVTEITQQDFIDLMLARNPQATLVNDKAVFPSPLN